MEVEIILDAILGFTGFVVWFLWIDSDRRNLSNKSDELNRKKSSAPIGLYLVNLTTAGLADTHFLKVLLPINCMLDLIYHLIESVPYFRFLMMGMTFLAIIEL